MPDSDDLVAQSHLTLEERVRARAFEIWQSRGEPRDYDTALDDWLQAEREVVGERGRDTAQDRATVVGSARTPSREKTRSLGEA